NVPGLLIVTLTLVPANRPPSGPGGTTPLSNEPSSAVNVWGLPPTLANRIAEPVVVCSCAGSKRRASPGRAGSKASARCTGAAEGRGEPGHDGHGGEDPKGCSHVATFLPRSRRRWWPRWRRRSGTGRCPRREWRAHPIG